MFTQYLLFYSDIAQYIGTTSDQISMTYICDHKYNSAENLHSGLDTLSIVGMYELIYCLSRIESCNREGLRILYKYLYHMTSNEKNTNPNWQDFTQGMKILYGDS